jgi:sterol desaturase/sphingolipid hydroxylase (fatty acid hydroxylase superfamily)
MHAQLTIFLPVLLLLAIALWELATPCRQSEMSRLYRWVNMGGMRLCGKLFFRFLVPLSQAQLALWCAQNGYGLFNHFVLPPWVFVVCTVALLDLSAYGIHAAAHHNQFLWRAHRTHHIDTEFDITTTLRTHPLDDLLNSLAECAMIIVMGLSAEAVVLYAVLSGILAKFSHANVELPARLDGILRWFIVTPNMHRIHHSAERHENDSNFSTHFTIWDRLFKTYRLHPEQPHATMILGQHQFRNPREIRLDRLLLRPFHERE